MPLFRRKSEKQASTSQNVHSGSRLPHSASNDSGLSASSWNGKPPLQRPQSLLLSDPGLLQSSDIPPEALESPIRTTSRLSKTLQEVLKDKDALSCFISFMKSERADHLIQFWCDAQSFQATTLMRMHTHELKNMSKSTLLKRRSGSFPKSSAFSEDGRNDFSPENGVRLADDSSNSMNFSQSACSPQDSLSTKNQLPGSSSSERTDRESPSPPSIHKSALLGQDSVSASTLTSQTCDNPSPQNLQAQSCNPSSIPVSQKDSCATMSPCPSLPSNPRTEAAHSANDCRFTHRDNVQKRLRCDSAPTTLLYSDNPCQPSTQTKQDSDYGPAVLFQNGPVERDLSIDRAETGPSQSAPSTHHKDEQTKEDVAAKLRKSVERDAVTIFSNYIAKDAPRPIGVDDQLRADAISKICLEDGNVDPECFQQCQEFVLKRIEVNYFQSFRDSEFHCRHIINVLTSGQVFLPDILLMENALCYFMEYMEQEGASDLMQLWLALENFQQQLTVTATNHDWEQVQNDAMVIYDKYFSLQAIHPMGFSDKLRFEIEENICREGGPLPDCFTKAKIIVLRTLDQVHFSHYLNSPVFHRYLSDLVSTVQMSEDLQHKSWSRGHRRNASDASSEHSIGSQSTGGEQGKPRNTLLAVDTRKIKKGGTHIEGDFSMSMEMFNPDELWKRTSPGGMSLGSVDELGQFVSGFDTDAVSDKKKGSGFLKRWKDKEKEQEEMALQIAQMIIKDVNLMTRPKDEENANDDKDGS